MKDDAVGDVQELIEEIAPLNNAYRSAVRSTAVDGAGVLEIMWDAGEVLAGAGVKKVDPVAWQIYGRTKERRRSYITRSFVVYCFRVRRYFPAREDIRKQFPALARYSLFREALPLLDNRKYALAGAEREGLVKLLNSGRDPRKIREEIAGIKRGRVGERDARDSRLKELEGASAVILARHQELVEINASRDKKKIRALRRRLGDDTLLGLSRLCLPLFSEEFPAPDCVIDCAGLKGAWRVFCDALSETVAGGPATRNRMRRLVRPVVFMELAEMLSAARSGSLVEHGLL